MSKGEIVMRLSNYLQSRPLLDDVVGIYSPFGHEFAYVSAADWADLAAGRLERLNPSVLSGLVTQRIVVEDGFEDVILNDYLPPQEHIREMWLVVEQACNMGCQYCVTEGNVRDPSRRVVEKRDAGTKTPEGHRRRDTMRVEVALAAVAKFGDYLRDSRPSFPRVTLYGGEPLLNWPTVKAAIPAIRSLSYPGQLRDKPVQALVITNGLIIREEIVEFFAEHDVAVSVSIDGQHHHDSQRVSLSGKGTFERTSKALRQYKDAGLNVGICTTVGTHNFRDLPEIVDFFATEFNCAVELQVPFEIPFNGGNRTNVRMVDAAPYAMAAFERLRERGLLEGLAGRRLHQVARGKFHHRDCSAVGGQVVVAADGSVGPCHALAGERTFFGGNVLDENSHPWDNPAFHEWSRRQPVNMPGCHGCSAIAVCGGGCPYNAHTVKGSIWEKDPQQCSYMHYLVDWLIEDVWKNGRPRVNALPC